MGRGVPSPRGRGMGGIPRKCLDFWCENDMIWCIFGTILSNWVVWARFWSLLTGSSEKLAISECRKAGCVTPRVGLLLVLPYHLNRRFYVTQRRLRIIPGFRNDDIYWRGSIGQKHSATTSPQQQRLSAQNFNLAPKFSAPNCAFFDKNFPTRKSFLTLSDSPKFRAS